MIPARLRRINGLVRCETYGRSCDRICKSKTRWGEAHHAISATLLNNLTNERRELRKLVAALSALVVGYRW